MSHSQRRVRTLIGDIRSRWRRRALLQGTALTVGVLAGWGILLFALYGLFAVPAVVLVVGAAIGALAGIGLAVRYIAWPAFRSISDRQIALYVEEQVPELEDRLNSAVEIEDSEAARAAHGVLVDRLIDDAAQRTRSVPLTTIVERNKERLLAGVSAAAVLLFLVLGYSFMDDLRVSVSTVDLAALGADDAPLMTIDPGHVEIEQGASQEVVVTLREDTERDVVLTYRSGEGEWQKATMQPALGEPAFLHAFTNVQEPIEYFVEYDQQRSEVYGISLYTFPEVAQIDLTYTYPEYTGRSSRMEENTGDIMGVKGTTVTLDVATTGAVATAELVKDDGENIPLQAAGDGAFQGTMQLETDGFYRVRLTDTAEKQNKFPEEYQIVAVEDEQPLISILDPQRDGRANAIEEVLVAARAEDDFGVRDLQLHFAVNAGEEQTIALKEDDGLLTDVEGDHLFFLEDYQLEPGDVISYFVEAADAFHDRPAASDMYFIEVIPFDQEYTQVTAGGGGGRGGGQSGIVLNQQQIITATWKLHRERVEMSGAEVASSRQALVQAQNNLRRNIEERISSTAFSLELQQDETNRQIVSLLRDAIEAMEEAVDELRDGTLREALTPEREALNHLLKADALNTDQEVTLSRNQQGGGGGSAATEERMTELMDLELDIARDKYETLPQQSQRGGQAGGQELDEAMQRLRELSRRQESLANQSRRELEGEDPRRQVERLQRDQDELRREAQALSRSMSRMARQDERLGEDVEQQLDRAARNMEEAERALREGDVQRAQARQQQAINDLERITRDLQTATNTNQRQTLEEMGRQFEQLRDQGQQLAEDVQRASRRAQERNGRIDPDELRDLAGRREALREQLDALDQNAEELAGRGAEDPELASAARNLQQSIRREALEEQMERSEQALARGWLDNARRQEESIDDSMQRVEDAMRAFEGQLPVTDEERLMRSLDALRELEREMQAMQSEAERQGNLNQGQRSTASSQGQQPATSGQGQASESGQGGDRAARAAAARRQARLDRAREQLERLQQDMGGTPAAGAIDRLRGAIEGADNNMAPIDGEAAEAFFNEDVFAPLSELEEALLRELDQIAMEKKLYGSRPADVPPEYRELVERYYESLSKSQEQ